MKKSSENDNEIKFYEEYQNLCKKHNLKLGIRPILKRQDNGTFSIDIEHYLVELSSEDSS